MERFDVAVVGAGVVGLACALSLASRGARTLLLERGDRPCLEQSSHNSRVLHSGIFVQPGTLRARLCVAGNRSLSEWARSHGVPVDISGTLVVATAPADLPRLERYLEWGRMNAVERVERISAAHARKIEPGLAPVLEAVWAPTGGRIDAEALGRALDREVERLGVRRVYGFGLARASRSTRGWELSSDGGRAELARTVVNASGVACARVARLFGEESYEIFPCLGEYARVRGDAAGLIRSMVYGFPPPGYPGIGVHLTRMLDGELWIGPTAAYLSGAQLPKDPLTSLEEFYTEAHRLLPTLERGQVERAPAGIRAKSVPPGSSDAFGDFRIEEAPPGSGVIQLIGIESPGLTASLAVGEHVGELWAGISRRAGGS